jgi:hypothetical protein
MIRLAAAMAVVAALVATGAYGWREHARAERLARELAEAKEARARAENDRKGGLASLGEALSTAMTARRARAAQAHAETTTPGAAKPEHDKPFEDLPPETQAGVFEAMDKYKGESKDKLDAMKRKLHLTPEQDQVLQGSIDKMNERLAKALDDFAVLVSKTGKPRPRQIIDVVGDGFNAVRENDDAFLATLDDQQRAALEADGFDMTGQVDPVALFPRVLALAAAMPDSKEPSKGHEGVTTSFSFSP